MGRRRAWLVGCSLAAVLVAFGPARADAGFLVHEWGTFTTHHGPDGHPVVWQPLQIESDLPRFVYRASSRATRKNTIAGTVRMETPVLYFYAERRQTASVTVGFPSGLITEWYPRVRRTSDGVRWPRVTITPGVTARLKREAAPSHYYPARETDSAMLRCRTQHEKFLFYRGVGTFATPLRARLDGDLVHVETVGADAVGRGVVVERRGDALGFGVVDLGQRAVVVERPAATPDALAGLEATFRGMLVAEGLYEREAQAMLDTWRGTWAEAGLRVLYVVPARLTADVLPLVIDPAPTSVVRVLIGRAEILPPAPAS
jgi:hypothetical protein